MTDAQIDDLLHQLDYFSCEAKAGEYGLPVYVPEHMAKMRDMVRKAIAMPAQTAPIKEGAFSCARRAADPGNEFAACRKHCGDTDACIAAIDAATSDAQDAARWRAFLNSARIRMLGSAGLTRPMSDNYAHLGMEIWTKYDAGNGKLQQGNAVGREWLTQYADIAIAAQAEPK